MPLVDTKLKLTTPASRLWDQIPAEAQIHHLSNAWCPKCRTEVVLSEAAGSVRTGNIMLVGSCAVCQGDATRIVELVPIGSGSKKVKSEKVQRTGDQAIREAELVIQEVAPMKKRINQLTKKARYGVLTNEEDKELNALFKIQHEKLMDAAMRLFGSSR